MKKSLLFALCLGLATITAAAQRNNSQVDPIQPVPTAKLQVAWQKLKTYAFPFGLNTFNDKEWGWKFGCKTLIRKLDCETMGKNPGCSGHEKESSLHAKHHERLLPLAYTHYRLLHPQHLIRMVVM